MLRVAPMWRVASAEEDKVIIEMCLELYREDPSPKPVPKEHTQHTLAILRAEPSRGRPVVLDFDGQIAGYALLISFWSNEMGGEVCHIDELYVRPQFRSRGLGTKLVETLAAGSTSFWSKKPVAIELGVTPQNARARALYTKLGFLPQKNTLMRIRF